MRRLRRPIVVSAAGLFASLAFLAPATAATSTLHPLAPFPPCSDHFQLSRSGVDVHVVGTDLKAFSSSYMLVFASANGDGHGPYNASPNSGANFTFNSGKSSKTDVGISLTNDNNTDTLCASTYYV
jgi:hypothetical protein